MNESCLDMNAETMAYEMRMFSVHKSRLNES